MTDADVWLRILVELVHAKAANPHSQNYTKHLAEMTDELYEAFKTRWPGYSSS